MEKTNLEKILEYEHLRVLLARRILQTCYNHIYCNKRISKWNRGVYEYASELAENLICTQNGKHFFDYLLNGAFEYARGKTDSERLFNACKEHGKGCSLIYDAEICDRLATDSAKTRYTQKDGTLSQPNARETWTDVQTRAIYQASLRVFEIAEKLAKHLQGEMQNNWI